MAFAFISVWTALSAGARLGTLQDDTPHQIHLAPAYVATHDKQSAAARDTGSGQSVMTMWGRPISEAPPDLQGPVIESGAPPDPRSNRGAANTSSGYLPSVAYGCNFEQVIDVGS